MIKLTYFLILVVIILFFFYVFNYYSSNENIKNTNLNRVNTDIILQKKISDLPILKNDTNNVINFNLSFSEEIKDDKPRSFWNLLKFK